MTSSPLVEIHLLGRFSLTADGEELAVQPAGERVLAFLGLQGTVRRETVAWTLWQDRQDQRASQCLRSALWRLPKSSEGPFVVTNRGELSLSKDIAVDVRRSRRLALALDVDDPATRPTEAELEHWTVDLLPGWYDDWLSAERERYRQLRLHALERLSERASRAGYYARAIELALRAVDSDPLRETAHRCIVHAHLAEGNVADAKDQLMAYLTSLDNAELSVAVSPRMVAEFASAGVVIADAAVTHA